MVVVVVVFMHACCPRWNARSIDRSGSIRIPSHPRHTSSTHFTPPNNQGWQKIHSGGPKALESSWKYLPPNGRFGGPGAVEGRDYFATLDDVVAFVKKAGAGALPSSRAPGQQHGGQPAPAHAAAAATPAPQQQPAPSSSLAATAALAEQGRARVEGMSKRQRLEAVFRAAFSGDAALLAALVKADKSLLKAEAEGGPDGEDEGATPLLVASRRGHAECVRVLLDEGPVEMLKQVDARGRSALHSAARGDHAPVARLLVERGLKPTFRRPEEGHTPLMVAARHNAARVARFLLQECPTASHMTQLKIRCARCWWWWWCWLGFFGFWGVDVWMGCCWWCWLVFWGFWAFGCVWMDWGVGKGGNLCIHSCVCLFHHYLVCLWN